MSSYKTDQRQLVHRGRQFHFVSYDGTPANPRLAQDATQPAWYLMSAGKRWPVMPQVADLSEAALDRALLEWLDAHVFPPAFSVPTTVPPRKRRR